MKPRPSRTFNPLHFDDLDPHRFEDLVRQLVYGFRNWNRLEAIGRSGADAGVDIRGVELHRSTEPDEEEDESELAENRVFGSYSASVRSSSVLRRHELPLKQH
jgi:hypothetical protein